MEYGDRLLVVPGDSGEHDHLDCEHPCVTDGEDNLVFARRLRLSGKIFIGIRREFSVLKKNIPVGAGLGGGSSDAVAALRALNSLAGRPLDSRGDARHSCRPGR